MKAPAGNGGVGRDRVNVAPGSVAFGDRGNTCEHELALSVDSVLVPGTGASAAVVDRGSFGTRARQTPIEQMRDLDPVFGERARGLLGSVVDAWRDKRARGLLGSAVDAWCAAWASVVRSVSSTRSAHLNQVARVGSSLLRHCRSSLDLFVAAVGSARLAPHIHRDVVRHWFGTVKTIPGSASLFRALAPGAPVCVTRGGGLDRCAGRR